MNRARRPPSRSRHDAVERQRRDHRWLPIVLMILVSESVKEAAGNAAGERQETSVVGKVAGSDVSNSDGVTLIRAGDTITAEQASEAERLGLLGALTAADRERQQAYVVGRVTGTDVTAPDGFPDGFTVIRRGEIVTEWHATSADTHGALESLVGHGRTLQQAVQARPTPASAASAEETLGRPGADGRARLCRIVAGARWSDRHSGGHRTGRAAEPGAGADRCGASRRTHHPAHHPADWGSQVGTTFSAGVQNVQGTAQPSWTEPEHGPGAPRTRRRRGRRSAVSGTSWAARSTAWRSTARATASSTAARSSCTGRSTRRGRVTCWACCRGSTRTTVTDPLTSRPSEHGQAALPGQNDTR